MRIKLSDPTPEQQEALNWLGEMEDCAGRFLRTHRLRAKRNRARIVEELKAAFPPDTKQPSRPKAVGS